MGKIVYFVAASLDGFIADPHGNTDWLFTDRDYGFTAFYRSVKAVIMGRRTYEKILEFGPYPFSDKMSYIFTHRQMSGLPNINFIHHSIPEFTAELKQKIKEPVWFAGGGEIARILFTHALIDQIVISIHPVYLGAGIPVTQSLPRISNFMPEKQRRYPSGLIQVTYSFLSDY